MGRGDDQHDQGGHTHPAGQSEDVGTEHCGESEEGDRVTQTEADQQWNLARHHETLEPGDLVPESLPREAQQYSEDDDGGQRGDHRLEHQPVELLTPPRR